VCGFEPNFDIAVLEMRPTDGLSEGTQINRVFSESRFERGQPVGLRLDVAGCLVFPEEGDPVTVLQ
jgi:hypothetical protein